MRRRKGSLDSAGTRATSSSESSDADDSDVDSLESANGTELSHASSDSDILNDGGSEHNSDLEDVFAWRTADHHGHYDEDATWYEEQPGNLNGDGDYGGEVEEDPDFGALLEPLRGDMNQLASDSEGDSIGIDSDLEADYPRL
ncbi:hypothetical protein BN946_scf184746.g30 [Trametes cinnabarina]|uniref:Uncharacterized protein n=1 Tax=Pycnoporus cinnabarinus TaxID=5643 RepID=A0A060SAQ3_PYCCI|nr:hypothetical protein BN946_scf184746.g30 [Trametes cinnabarina]